MCGCATHAAKSSVLATPDLQHAGAADAPAPAGTQPITYIPSKKADLNKDWHSTQSLTRGDANNLAQRATPFPTNPA